MTRFFKRALYIALSFIVFLGFAAIIWPEADYVPYEGDAAYRAQALAYPVAPMPADWTVSTYSAPDGTAIHYGQSGARESAKATVVFVPGYTSAIDFYGDQYAMLTARGYHVVALDLRGQGRSGRYRDSHPEKLYARDFSVYGDDIAGVLTQAELGAQRPVILMGMSFGGAAVTRALIDHDLNVHSALLLAPAYRPNTAPYSIQTAKALVGVARAFGKGKRYGFGQGDWKPDGLDMTRPTLCGSYPERLYTRDAMYMRHPELRVGGATSNWIGEIIENGEFVTQAENLKRLGSVPITMIAAANDVIIDSSVSERACEDGIEGCKLVVIPETGHCLTLENDKVINAIHDELDAMLER